MSKDEDELSKKISSINLKSDINILLLGETGVGKSTFINAMANYLHFKDFTAAEKDNLQVLIPALFSMEDKYGINREVRLADKDDKNESLQVGDSATQDVKTYVFPIYNGGTNVRLIDTPGLVDTRGVEQDKENCENILDYLGNLNELHAICILLKTSTTRITPNFEYCIKEILTHLEKSAANNIIFCFTNARGANFTPGDTNACMQKVIQNIQNNPPNVQIPFKRNKFCFDNESFRYLAAVKNNVDLDNSIRVSSILSWNKSTEQCWNMIKYIVGDATNKPLPPHQVKTTISINETRRMIGYLSQPMLDITQNIENNIRILDRHKNLELSDHRTLDELKKKLYMPVINLQTIKLTQPVTVCTSIGCTEVIKVEGTNSVNYTQRCHDPCYLKNIPKEMIGDAGLTSCAAMSNKMCTKCSCSFMTHMHIYYMTKKVSDNIVDKNIIININTKQAMMVEVKKLIQNCETRVNELEQEHDVIVKTAASFAHFLSSNAITPYNDAYASYINYLIKREEGLGSACDHQAVNHLNRLKERYNELKKAFEYTHMVEPVTAKKVKRRIEDLYALKHYGKKIKEMYQSQRVSRKKEYENTEYVHKMPFQKTGAKKKPAGNTKPTKSKPPTYEEAINPQRPRPRPQNQQFQPPPLMQQMPFQQQHQQQMFNPYFGQPGLQPGFQQGFQPGFQPGFQQGFQQGGVNPQNPNQPNKQKNKKTIQVVVNIPNPEYKEDAAPAGFSGNSGFAQQQGNQFFPQQGFMQQPFVQQPFMQQPFSPQPFSPQPQAQFNQAQRGNPRGRGQQRGAGPRGAGPRGGGPRGGSQNQGKAFNVKNSYQPRRGQPGRGFKRNVNHKGKNNDTSDESDASEM